MLGPFGETIVVDWGIAKPLVEFTGDDTVDCSPVALTQDASLTRPGTMIGTPEYMSPEQAGDLARVDRASDIYSLGATLYCLLVGHGPFPSGSVVDVLELACAAAFFRHRGGCGGRSIPRWKRSV